MLVAFSGGPDSTALLHLLLEVADERGLELSAAHFDHGVREGSGGEAERVARRCRAAGVPCTVGRTTDAPPDPSQEGLRRARYRFLRTVADERGADRIATGHQADDQAETVLFRRLRGTGLRGLQGIPERRDRIVRPLLGFRKERLLDWLEGQGLSWTEDPSNRDPRWSRGRLRTRLLPGLEEAWDGPLRVRLLQLSDAAGRADRSLDRRARTRLRRALVGRGGAWGAEAFQLRRGPLASAHSEVRARCVRILARELDVRATRGGTREAIQFITEGRSGGEVDLGDGLKVAREFDRIWVGRPDEAVPDTVLVLEHPDAGRDTVHVGGRRLLVAWGPELTPGGSAKGVELARPELRFPLRLRSRRDGDRLRSAGGGRKLKELFREERVPVSRRERSAVLVDGEGRVLWVEDLGSDPSVDPRRGAPTFGMRIQDV